MDIFLLRHGNAEPRAASDRDRQLTARGREEVSAVIRDNRASLSRVTAAFVSPYARAQQSFQVARETLPELAALAPSRCSLVTPDGNPHAVIDMLFHCSASAALLVSHQPLVGVLLDELCGFETGRYRMGTGSLAAIKMDEVVAKGLGEFLWLQHP